MTRRCFDFTGEWDDVLTFHLGPASSLARALDPSVNFVLPHDHAGYRAVDRPATLVLAAALSKANSGPGRVSRGLVALAVRVLPARD
ncbi:MAG: hypothetical protein ACREX8_17725, partial [Gammaproteobacteria bacterium]